MASKQGKRRTRARSSSNKNKAAVALHAPTVEVVEDKGGAPTKYEPRFCQMLIARCKNGKSFESFGSEVGVDRDTLYEWAKEHREFSDAKAIGKQHLLDFYEEATRNAALGIVPPSPVAGAMMTRANGKLLEFLMRVHGGEAGFQNDGSNKGMGKGPDDGKDTTVNFKYLDAPNKPPEEGE